MKLVTPSQTYNKMGKTSWTYLQYMDRGIPTGMGGDGWLFHPFNLRVKIYKQFPLEK